MEQKGELQWRAYSDDEIAGRTGWIKRLTSLKKYVTIDAVAGDLKSLSATRKVSTDLLAEEVGTFLLQAYHNVEEPGGL